ncbi:MAG: hypothetical protein P1P84_02005 [Deferrisomatales bacterium]|nr:hypothetical protein [Deferrisomatales bacterium]
MTTEERVRAALVAAVFLAVAAVWCCWPERVREGVRAPERGDARVRGVGQGMEYVEQDPATGATLRVTARAAVTRDGKVAGLFRTPLLPKTVLQGLEVEFRDGAGAVVLSGTSDEGRYDLERRTVTLEDPALRVLDRRVETKRVTLRTDGETSIPGPYQVFAGGELLWEGRRYAGPIARLGSGP